MEKEELLNNYKNNTIISENIRLLSETLDDLKVLEFIKTQLLLNGDLLLTEFGQDKFRNIIDHWKVKMKESN